MTELNEKTLSYGDYLKVSEITNLQNRVSNPPHHDELLFIIIHQAYELWFKIVLAEIERSISFLERDESLEARHYMDRVVQIFKILVPQIHILETMRPIEFLEFRDGINPASGFQSLQFREIEFLSGLKDERFFRFFQSDAKMLAQLQKRMQQKDLQMAFAEHLKNKKLTIDLSSENILLALRNIYENPEETLSLYLLCETLLEFDEYLSLFRFHHVQVVERMIGEKMGTGGSSGVEYLRATVSKRCFPLLWEVRSRLKKRH